MHTSSVRGTARRQSMHRSDLPHHTPNWGGKEVGPKPKNYVPQEDSDLFNFYTHVTTLLYTHI